MLHYDIMMKQLEVLMIVTYTPPGQMRQAVTAATRTATKALGRRAHSLLLLMLQLVPLLKRAKPYMLNIGILLGCRLLGQRRRRGGSMGRLGGESDGLRTSTATMCSKVRSHKVIRQLQI